MLSLVSALLIVSTFVSHCHNFAAAAPQPFISSTFVETAPLEYTTVAVGTATISSSYIGSTWNPSGPPAVVATSVPGTLLPCDQFFPTATISSFIGVPTAASSSPAFPTTTVVSSQLEALETGSFKLEAFLSLISSMAAFFTSSPVATATASFTSVPVAASPATITSCLVGTITSTFVPAATPVVVSSSFVGVDTQPASAVVTQSIQIITVPQATSTLLAVPTFVKKERRGARRLV
ncbi:hypothetical protein T439DRAFT_381889 [Meredithblackwellia eburnea MCA 4105]